MATNALSPSAIQVSMDRTQAERLDQYTLWQILGIWALVSLADGTPGLGSHSRHHSLQPVAMPASRIGWRSSSVWHGSLS